MPAAVAIPAAAAITGAVIDSRGRNRALSSQERTSNQQIALERERDAARNARYSQAMDSYREEKRQYDEMRRQLLAHYGVNIGGGGGGGQAPAGPPASPPAGGSGMNLGQLMGQPPGGVSGGVWGGGQTPAEAPPAAGLGPEGPGAPGSPDASAGGVFDWRRYGVS